MSDKHSNETILKEIEASHDLSKKVSSILDDAQDGIRKAFKKQFGFDVPSAGDALVLTESTTLQYASQSVISEYLDGLQGVIGPVLDGNFPKAALATTNLVTDVLNNVVGSGTVGSTNEFESQRSDDGGQDTISALMVSSTTLSQKDWKISKDFSVSAYMLIVFPATYKGS